MASPDAACYAVVQDSGAEYPSASELRQALEKGTDEVKIDTPQIITSTINGNAQVRDSVLETFSTRLVAAWMLSNAGLSVALANLNGLHSSDAEGDADLIHKQ